jgi:hypothetical protein
MTEINDYCVKNKLIIEKCKRIFPAHLIMYFDFKTKDFKIKALGSFYLNENLIPENTEGIPVKSFDKISFDCDLCYMPHIYVLVFPKTKEESTPNIDIEGYCMDLGIAKREIADKTRTATNLQKRLPDILLASKWTSHEKDCLRKYILIYGYGRWKIIKQNSGGVLSEKSEVEIKVFANAFIKTIVEFLPQEKTELRRFLIGLIDEAPEDPYILPKKEDWGTLIKQRAPAWGKRIQLIYRVCVIVEKFKSERKRNKEIKKKLESNEITEEENEELKKALNKTYDYWDNLLNFLPNHAFYGQRPSVWWTRTHDIDLLRGTYKYGYANYNMMRSDPKLSFSKLEKDSSFQEFPNADTITRRLKKLIQIIVKSENNGVISFEDRKNIEEPTGFTLEEKNSIINFLIDYGVPLNSEGKSDWTALKEIFVQKINLDHSKNPQTIERLVQRLRMISQLVIQLNENENTGSIDENMLEQMDPDNDGFNISFEEAEKLNKNMNILHYIRKHIISNNFKLFYNGLNNLIDLNKVNPVHENWDPSVHDKALLIAVNENGLNYLNNISNNKEYGFQNIELSYDEALARVNFLCEYFRDYSTGNKTKKRKDFSSHIGNIPTGELIQKKKTSKININRDEQGNIMYPIVINSSLQILNLGTIEYERSAYHSEKNLFPIGFTSVREHSSMLKLGERALYTCEILDGGSKPLYKLIPSEDPENPIIKESSTGCWIVICNRINALQGNKRNKVTISGTERFGLCDNNVVKLLQHLLNADKCTRYVMKVFED